MAFRASPALSPLVIAALHLCGALAIASASSDAGAAPLEAGAARSTSASTLPTPAPPQAEASEATGGSKTDVIGGASGASSTGQTEGIPGSQGADPDSPLSGTHARPSLSNAPVRKRAAESDDDAGGGRENSVSDGKGKRGSRRVPNKRASRPKSRRSRRSGGRSTRARSHTAQSSPRRTRARSGVHSDPQQHHDVPAAGAKHGHQTSEVLAQTMDDSVGTSAPRASGHEVPEQDTNVAVVPGTCLDTSTPGQCQPVGADGALDADPSGRVGHIQPAPDSWLAQAHETVVRVPVTVANTVAVLVLLGLAVLGSIYVYKLCTQPHCSCPMCEGDYVVQGTLGTGGFGAVYRVTRAVDKHDFVLKKIPVTDINDANDAHTEARELRFLQHPRIVGYEDDFMHTTPQSAGRDAHIYVCIIMELCERDLRQLLELKRDNDVGFAEEQLLKYLAQICSALSYCHGKQIIHRDIKPQNVFLDADDNVRLGDFGLCKAFRKAFTSYTDAGTDCYKAPETLLGGRRDGRKSDVWSLGLLLHEMTTLTLAWERGEVFGAQLLHYPSALDDIMRLVPNNYSPAFRRLMRRMLHPTATSRPTADDILGMKLLRRAVRADAKLRKKLNKQLKQVAESVAEEGEERSMAPRRWGKRTSRGGPASSGAGTASPEGSGGSGGSVGSGGGEDVAHDGGGSDDSGFFGIVNGLMTDADDSDASPSRNRRRRERSGPRLGSNSGSDHSDSGGAGRTPARAHTPSDAQTPATPVVVDPRAHGTAGSDQAARSASAPRPTAARHRKRARKKAKGGLNRRPPGTVAALDGAAVYAALQAAGRPGANAQAPRVQAQSGEPRSADAAVDPACAAVGSAAPVTAAVQQVAIAPQAAEPVPIA